MAELRGMSDEDLVRLHDQVAEHTSLGLNFYVDELHRRDTDRAVAASQRLALRSYWLAVANSVLALASVIVAVAALILSA